MNENKIDWIDNLRAVATISVIFLHVSAEIPTLYGEVHIDSWWVGNIVDSSVRFCVPLFLMISGALLLGRKMDIRNFFRRRLIRVLMPFFFWSFVYILSNIAFQLLNSQPIKIFEYVLTQLKYGSANHLWFVYMILGIYLFIPIINPWITQTGNKGILYFLGLWCTTLFIGLPYETIFGFNIDLYYFGGYLGYVVLGYFLAKRSTVLVKTANFVLIITYLFGFLVTSVGTYLLTVKYGKFQENFYEYLTPNVMLMAATVFLLGMKIRVHPMVNRLFGIISKYSFGIYLSHILVLILLRKLNVYWGFINPVISIPFVTLAVLSISLIIVFIVNKLPFGKEISG